MNDVEIEKVSFISIDMNCVGPEIAANFFWPKMVAGAFMLLDDYGFVRYEEQKSGFDAFAAERGTSVLALPSGRGRSSRTQRRPRDDLSKRSALHRACKI